MTLGNMPELAAFVFLCFNLGACADFETITRGDAPDTPTVRSVVTDEFHKAKMTGHPQVADLRQTTGPQPGDWMVCFKTDASEQALRYAVFFRSNKSVAARPAALIDGCDHATYTPLDAPLPHWPHE